jgi:ubiquinone/menaquinone biosynthesis C-methylase UbiE
MKPNPAFPKQTSPCPPLLISVLVLLLAGGLLQAGQRDLDEEAEFRQIAELLRLSAGSQVADVGAGGGIWSGRLATKVGEGGHVFSTEVKEVLVNGIRAGVKARGLSNVTVILADQGDIRLPEGCCDAALLRLVYHAFKSPEKMRDGLRQAMKPGGLVLLIDFRPPKEQLVREMAGAGFEAVQSVEKWRGQDGVYAVVFRKRF